MTGLAVSALVNRRREIQRKIACLKLEIRRCGEAIGHADATIRLLDPYYGLAKPKPKKFVAADGRSWTIERQNPVLEQGRHASCLAHDDLAA